FVSSSKPLGNSWRSRNPNPAASDSGPEESKAALIRLAKQGKFKVVAICDHFTKLKFSPAKPCVFIELYRTWRGTGQHGSPCGRERNWCIYINAFMWDIPKAIANFEKHGFPFEEAATVFGDSSALD